MSSTNPTLPPEVRTVVDLLTAMPEVRLLRLGGSRARGRPTSPTSDWDLLGYVEHLPDGNRIRQQVSASALTAEYEYTTGTAGGPLEFAELSISTRPRIDIGFRRIGLLDEETRRTAVDEFRVNANPKLPGGVPSYILVTELAHSVPLYGDRAAPPCSASFVRTAARWWTGRAACGMLLAADHVAADEPINAWGHVLAAVTSMAHARLLQRTGWYRITKRLLNEEGAVDDAVREILARMSGQALTLARTKEISQTLGVDEHIGLEWLAEGCYDGPPARRTPTDRERTPVS